MRRLIVTAAVLVSFGLPAAGQEDISGVRVNFTETRTRAGAVAQEMSGSLFLATDGSWRVDRVFRGETLSITARHGEQVEINHDLGVAVRGPAGSHLTVPTLQGYGATLIERAFSNPPMPGGAAQELMQDGVATDSYGQRAIGPLLLNGEGWAMDGHVIEVWSYRLPDNAVVTLEYRAEHTDENGMQTVDERRVTNWERVTAPLDTTFAIPRLLDPPASLQMSQVQVLIALSSPFQNSQLAGTEQTQPTCLWV